MTQRIVAISPSGLNNASCILKYKYSQIDRYRQRYRPSYFDKGTLGHLYLEHYYRARQAGSNSELAMIQSLETVAPEVVNLQLDIQEASEIAGFFKQYVQHYGPKENWEILEVESIFSFILYEDEDIQILAEGRKDLVVNIPYEGGKVLKTVIDHKFRSTSQAKKLKNLGNLSYAYAIYAMASNADLVIDNEISTANNPAKRFIQTPITFSQKIKEERRANIVYRVKSLISHIDRDYYPQDLTSCDKYFGCTFNKVCGAEPEFREFILNTEYEQVDHDLMAEEKKNE